MSAQPQEKPIIELPTTYSRREERDLPAVQANPMAMLASAVQRGMDPATLRDLMDLEKRWRKDEAERAYNEAFAAFKAEAVTIIKNRSVDQGPLNGKKYAELIAWVEGVTPALSKHGLSAAWRLTKDEKDWIEVTCTLKHSKGHSESVSMGGPPDAGGAKSAIQARASTVTYLERYTLKAITGLAESGDDTDGNVPQRMPETEIAEWITKIEATTTKEKAKAVWQEAMKAAQAAKDRYAAKTLKDRLIAHGEFIDKASSGQ